MIILRQKNHSLFGELCYGGLFGPEAMAKKYHPEWEEEDKKRKEEKAEKKKATKEREDFERLVDEITEEMKKDIRSKKKNLQRNKII